MKSCKKTNLAKASKKKETPLTDDEQAMAARHSKLEKLPKARITIEDKNVIGYDHEVKPSANLRSRVPWVFLTVISSTRSYLNL